MAPPLIRLAWPLAAAAALVFLVGLALHGGRPDPMVQFKPAGLLTAFAPEEARDVEIATAGGTKRLRRAEGRWNIDPATAERVDAALRLLRNSGPLRILTADEVAHAPDAEYGFGSSELRVSIRSAGGATFAVQFGGRNPLGSARYARIDGMDGVALLPAYVAEAWEAALGMPSR